MFLDGTDTHVLECDALVRIDRKKYTITVELGKGTLAPTGAEELSTVLTVAACLIRVARAVDGGW